VGKVDSINNAANSNAGPNVCVSGESTNFADYEGAFLNGNCGSANALVYLYKGPSTTTECGASTDPMVIRNGPGISPSDPSNGACNTNFQNITLRGVAPGSAPIDPAGAAFGFEGKITLTFLLKNGEHPHFVITPKMYVKSICIDGAFQGSSSTCRGSPYWPVPVAVASDLPTYICEEPDARTFGPTDWAAIFFDIKDVAANLVEMKKLNIVVGGTDIRFFPQTSTEFTPTGTWYRPTFEYFNFRNLKSINSALLVTPTSPTGVTPPKNTDFGFAFTPGAHNENAKITIYCTLRIKSSKLSSRRFGAQAEQQESENQVTEKISINRNTNAQLSSLSSSNRVVESGANNNNGNVSNNGGSSVTVMVLAAACAVLLAAVIGMVLYVVRQRNVNAPKRVHSNA
jgi:hypothetical protein